MAGTPTIRSGPVASITSENFDSSNSPAQDGYTLNGNMKNDFPNTASYIIFSTGFNSNADQFTGSGGDVIVGNVLSVSMSDDTTKGPYHCSAISNCVGPVGTGPEAVSLYFEDGTNGGYHEMFSDAEYTGGWVQVIGDPSKTPDTGSALSVTATLTHAGLYMDSITGGEAMFELIATAISWCGREIQVDGGTSTPGSEIDFNSISLRDRLTTRSTTSPITGQYYGHVWAKEGIISLGGPIQLGDDGSTNNTYFLETDTFCLWADNPVNTKFYRIDILSNGGSNSTTVIWGTSGSPAGITIDCAGTVNRWALDTATTEPDEFSAYVCTLKRGRAWDLGSTSTIDGGVLQDITDITMHVDAEILNAQMIDVKLIYGLPPVTGQLTGSTFSSPSTYCMTISTQTANMTVDYEFDASCRGSGEAIQFTHASGNIHVTASAGYYQLVLADVTVSGAGTVTFATSSATVDINVKDETGANIQNARVFIETAATIASGEAFEVGVTSITQAAGVATCTCSAVHGLETSDKVVIRGAQPDNYNRTATVTVTSTTVFTYSVDSGTSSPATGTPLVSYVPIHALTNASGNVSVSRAWGAAQDFKGWARKSTTAPFFRQSAIAFTVNVSNGASIGAVLLSDE